MGGLGERISIYSLCACLPAAWRRVGLLPYYPPRGRKERTKERTKTNQGTLELANISGHRPHGPTTGHGFSLLLQGRAMSIINFNQEKSSYRPRLMGGTLIGNPLNMRFLFRKHALEDLFGISTGTTPRISNLLFGSCAFHRFFP